MRRFLCLLLTAWLLAWPGWASAQGCDCSADVYNCDEFASQPSAQACYEQCLTQTGRDIHDLDRNSNSLACEDSTFTGSLDFTSPQPEPTAAPPPAPPAAPPPLTIPPSGAVLSLTSPGALVPGLILILVLTTGILGIFPGKY